MTQTAPDFRLPATQRGAAPFLALVPYPSLGFYMTLPLRRPELSTCLAHPVAVGFAVTAEACKKSRVVDKPELGTAADPSSREGFFAFP